MNKLRAFFLLCALTLSGSLLLYLMEFQRAKYLAPNLCGHSSLPKELALKQEIANKLVLAAKEVYKSQRYMSRNIAKSSLLNAQNRLDELLMLLDIKKPVFQVEQEHVNFERLVCPEIYKGSKAGYPFYQKTGWDMEPCTDIPPFNKVITILLNFQRQTYAIILSVLKGFEEFYPSLHVFVATDSDYVQKQLNTESLNLSLKFFSCKGMTAGRTWRMLLAQVDTPYVLIGRNLERVTWDVRLERQVRVAHLYGLGIVGGAIRTPDGHWSMGCRQMSLQNYTLAYIEGYDMSRNSCLYCEHLTGPFVGKTSYMKHYAAYQFDTDLTENVLFEDFFIRIKENDGVNMVCPDAMYFVEDTESRKEIKETWLPLVIKWQLNQVQLYNKKVHSYTCEEAKITCEYKTGIAVPICCLEILAKAMNKVFEVFEKHGLVIESDTGNIMGSIKFGGILPWERDGDITYLARNKKDILNAKEEFTSLGYKLEEKGVADFNLYIPGWRIEFWSMGSLTSERDIKEQVNRTRVYTHGYWQIVPRNPGYFAISRYGNEVFKQTEHWMSLGQKSSWTAYKTGTFASCPKPGHHACLDQFSADGNIQFKGPWL